MKIVGIIYCINYLTKVFETTWSLLTAFIVQSSTIPVAELKLLRAVQRKPNMWCVKVYHIDEQMQNLFILGNVKGELSNI